MVMPISPFASSKKGNQSKQGKTGCLQSPPLGQWRKNNMRYTQVYGTLMILAIRVTHKQRTTRKQARHSMKAKPTKIEYMPVSVKKHKQTVQTLC